MELFAFNSHQKAISAIESGIFKNEIIPVNGLLDDETPRRDTSLERMSTLEPLIEGHSITAALSSQMQMELLVC